MTPPPNPISSQPAPPIQIYGALWEAKATPLRLEWPKPTSSNISATEATTLDVLKHSSNKSDDMFSFEFRSFFIRSEVHEKIQLEQKDGTTRIVPAARIPGAGILACRIHELKVSIGGKAYTWKRDNGASKMLTGHYEKGLQISDLVKLVESGELSLMALAPAPDTKWSDLKLSTARLQCLDARIPLMVAGMSSAPGSGAPELMAALGFPGGAPNSALTATALGLALRATPHLPWEANERDSAKLKSRGESASQKTTLPFLLTPEHPLTESGAPPPGRYRLSIDEGRLTAAQAERLANSGQMLQSLLPGGIPGRRIRNPHWIELGLADPSRLRFSYVYTSGASPLKRELRLDGGQVSAALADQRTEASPQGVARFSFPVLIADEDQTGVVLRTPKSTLASEEPRLEYELSAVATTGADVMQEKWTLSKAQLSPHPTDWPRRLRELRGMPAPEWRGSRPENDPKSQEVVWTALENPTVDAYLQLELGVLQLPVPNLTEQIYASWTRAIKVTRDEEPAGVLRGGAVYGNDRPEYTSTNSALAGEQPWSLSILGAQNVNAKFVLPRNLNVLPTGSLTLVSPKVIVSGLLWVRTGNTTAEDALPSLDAWTDSLEPVSLWSANHFSAQPPLLRFELTKPLVWTSEPLYEEGALPPKGQPEVRAALETWDLQAYIDVPTYKQMRDLGNKRGALLPKDTFAPDGERAWFLWQRHESIPFVQGVPLTQTKMPPNFPSSSRQLLPYQLRRDPSFPLSKSVEAEYLPTLTLNGKKATAWPDIEFKETGRYRWVPPAFPGAMHKDIRDLPAAALSLPGIFRFAAPPREQGGIRKYLLSYRHDLPYLDEIYALSLLPRRDKGEEESGQDGAAEVPRALPPKDMISYWRELSERAALARADASDTGTTPGIVDGTEFWVETLLEPYRWRVQPELRTPGQQHHTDTPAYPGELRLLELVHKEHNALTLKGEKALEGISGRFEVCPKEGWVVYLGPDGEPTDPTQVFHFLAGSAPTRYLRYEEPIDTAVDQRGLGRLLTRRVADVGSGKQDAEFLITSARLLRTVFTTDDVKRVLITSRHGIPVGSGAPNAVDWAFWFRDLPLNEENLVFRPVRLEPSSADTDVNDFQARTRARDFLSGYEWRLAQNSTDTATAHLDLYGLAFFPLQLVEAAFAGKKGALWLKSFQIIGRLQLPLGNSVAMDSQTNLVSLTFTRTGADKPLLLDSLVRLEENPIAWPLTSEKEDAKPDAPEAKDLEGTKPRLMWREAKPTSQSLQILATKLAFRHLEFDWELEVGDLMFPAGAGVDNSKVPPPASENALTLRVFQMKLEHQAEKRLFKPTLEVEAVVRLVEPPVTQGAPSTPILASKKLLSLANPDGTQSQPSYAPRLELFGRLSADYMEWMPSPDPRVFPQAVAVESTRALTFQWTSVKPLKDTPVALLPGMMLLSSDKKRGVWGPGFASALFRREAGSSRTSASLASGFVEASFVCQWGTFLSDVENGAALKEQEAFSGIFGSSAGHVTAGFTSMWERVTPHASGKWKTSLLLNGLLEVKNLVSWPAELASTQDATGVVTIPSFPAAGAPTHVRHVAQILLNQSAAPEGGCVVNPKESATLLSLTKAWQFLTTVEHRLSEVSFKEKADSGSAGRGRKGASGSGRPAPELGRRVAWTVVQEVRFCPLGISRDYLTSMREWKDGSGTKHKVEYIDPVADSFVASENQVRHLGYLSPRTLSLLLKELPAADNSSPDEALLVEASAVHWIRSGDASLTPTILEARRQTLLSLPNGTLWGEMSRPEDYLAHREASQEEAARGEWLLGALQFLGRIQPPEYDQLETVDAVRADSAPAGEDGSLGSLLRRDPLLALWQHRKSGDTTAPAPLLLSFSGWGWQATPKIRIAPLEWPRLRDWAPDQTNLEEAWFRIAHPWSENTGGRSPEFTSILATRVDSAGRLSRSAALRRAFDTRGRWRYLPPALPPFSAPEEIRRSLEPTRKYDLPGDPTGTLEWRPGQRLAPHSIAGRLTTIDYPWLTMAVLLDEGLLQPLASKSGRRFASATFLPSSETTTDTLPPAVLAVSPYLSLGITPASPLEPTSVLTATSSLAMLNVELLAIRPDAPTLNSVLSRSFEKADTADPIYARALLWGRELYSAHAQGAASAVLRLRGVFNVGSEVPVMAIGYGYCVIRVDLLNEKLPVTLAPVRGAIAQLRFADGQFGGTALPDLGESTDEAIAPAVCLAPPLLAQVRPFREENLNHPDQPSPWGWSGLRVETQLSGRSGAIGPQLKNAGWGARQKPPRGGSLYWQAPEHSVQFRPWNPDGAPAASLPPLFRAPAIAGLLPVLPRPAMPSVRNLLDEVLDRSDDVRSVLPAAIEYAVTGTHPGAMINLRHHLITQAFPSRGGANGADAVVSGGVPVEHRFPRPVALPSNYDGKEPRPQEFWLQTIAHEADTRALLQADQSPFDEAYFLPPGQTSFVHLRATVLSTIRGALSGDEPEPFLFEILPISPAGLSVKIMLHLAREGNAVGCELIADPKHPHQYHPDPTSKQAEKLRALLRDIPPGSALSISLLIYLDGKAPPAEPARVMTLSVRRRNPNQLQAPTTPVFVQFQDPEYNRRLNSAVARAAATGLLKIGETPHTYAVSIAADRQEYNADTPVAIRVRAQQLTKKAIVHPNERKLTLAFFRGTAKGTVSEIRLKDKTTGKAGPRPAILVNSNTPSPQLDVQFSMDGFVESGGQPVRFQPSHTLIIQVGEETGREFVGLPFPPPLTLRISETPVVSAPEAAYALLRGVTIPKEGELAGTVPTPGDVDCPRFAWRPPASRVEMLSLDDLDRDIIRRRAVFRWLDVARSNDCSVYSLQKISGTGSTHVPTATGTFVRPRARFS